MDNSNKKQFAEIMMGLADNFGGTVSPEGMRARFNALSKYDISQIVSAGGWLIERREKTFPAMPMVSEFVSAIEAQASPQISSKSLAEIQVDIVLKHLRYFDSSIPVDFKDPITKKLMTDRWPYSNWATSVLEKDIVWWRKEFIEAYMAYSESDYAHTIALPPGKNIDALKKLAMGISQ